VIGWALGARVTGDLAQQALTMAIRHRTPKAGWLHHSDRSSQYAATAYQQLRTTQGMTGSMSRRGNCWDNACVESFFGTLKRERIYHRQYRTRDEATQDIFEYIEVFSNRLVVTPHSATIPRLSSKRGRRWLNQVSTESGEGQTSSAIIAEDGRGA
jgi:putative transposase